METKKRTCDKCQVEIKDEPYWVCSEELFNSPGDMEDRDGLDTTQDLCLKCKPLGEYKKEVEEE